MKISEYFKPGKLYINKKIKGPAMCLILENYKTGEGEEIKLSYLIFCEGKSSFRDLLVNDNPFINSWEILTREEE